MSVVNATSAQIIAALNREGHRLGAGQFTFSIPGAGSLWPGYAAATQPMTSYAVLSPLQATAFRLAIAGWDELILPNFAEVADNTATRGEVRAAFTGYDMTGGTAAYAYSGPPQFSGGKVGDVWIDSDDRNANFARGTANYETLVHEIGHTLGLSHSFGSPAIPAPYENTRYTVMSYTPAAASLVIGFTATGGGIRTTASYASVATPMVLDIAAVQAIYGADPTTRAGDTVYSFNQDDTTLQSIYDAGGNDTIDLSNFTRPNIVDLTPGSYSSIGLFDYAGQVAYWSARLPGYDGAIRSTLSNASLFVHADNLGIAMSALIENAFGGSSADTITGNAAANLLRGMGGDDALLGDAGDDTLDGGAGDDVLTGGAGADVFRFSGSNDGNDRIVDFAPTQDRFDLSGGSFTAVTEAGGATTLRHAGGTVAVAGVVGLTLAQWNALAGIAAPAPAPVPQYVLIAGAGVQATVIGSGSVAAGASGVQDITVRDVAALIAFGATFNEGGDRIHLSGNAGAWTAARSGSTVFLSDGDTEVRLPAGTAGVDIVFDDGVRTLRVDEAAGAIKLGAQVIGSAAQGITAAAGPATATGATDATLPAQLNLVGAGPVTVSGNLRLAGSTTVAETVVVESGSVIAFGATFNAGGDTIQLPGSAASYTAARSGTTITLASGSETISVPGGTVGLALGFAGGDMRTLIVDTAAGVIRIGQQAIGATAAPLSAAPAVAFADAGTLSADEHPQFDYVGATPMPAIDHPPLFV